MDARKLPEVQHDILRPCMLQKGAQKVCFQCQMGRSMSAFSARRGSRRSNTTSCDPACCKRPPTAAFSARGGPRCPLLVPEGDSGGSTRHPATLRAARGPQMAAFSARRGPQWLISVPRSAKCLLLVPDWAQNVCCQCKRGPSIFAFSARGGPRCLFSVP